METPNSFDIRVPFGAYNYFTHSAPLIQKVTSWSLNLAPKYQSGTREGNYEDGGFLMIDALAGDIIKTTQKFCHDQDDPRLSKWFIVQDDGSLQRVTRSQAKNHWHGYFGPSSGGRR